MIDLLSIMLLALSAVPAVKLCFQPVLWSRFSREGVLLAIVITAYAALIAAAWRYFPWLLPYAAIVTAIPATFFWWRARPGYGMSRGLPPGSLSMVRSLRSVGDPDFYQERGDRFGQVFKMSQFHRPTCCVTSIARGSDLIRSNEDKLTPAPMPFDRFVPRRFIRFMEQQDHRHYRQILKKIIRPGIIDANNGVIQKAAASHLRRMGEASRDKAGVHPMSFMRAFANDVFPALFFGFTPGGDDLGQLQGHYRRLDEFGFQQRCPDEVEAILCDIEAMVLSRADTYLNSASDEPRSSFLEELVHIDPDAIHDVTLRRNLIYMIGIGRGDVTGFLNWNWHFLCRNPAWVQKLRQEPGSLDLVNWRQPISTVDRFIAEVLRMEQSEYLYREVLDEVEWEGFRIPRGWLLRVCIHEGHRNADLFRNPDEFDPDRFVSRKFKPAEYSPLGVGRHSCLGAHMLFALARGVLLELTSNYDIELIHAGKRTLGGRHWMHWKPGESFAVKLYSSPVKG